LNKRQKAAGNGPARFAPGARQRRGEGDSRLHPLDKVAWVRPSGGKFLVGLHFTDVDPDQRKALKNLVQKAMQVQS